MSNRLYDWLVAGLGVGMLAGAGATLLGYSGRLFF